MSETKATPRPPPTRTGITTPAFLAIKNRVPPSRAEPVIITNPKLYGFFSRSALDTRGVRTLIYRSPAGQEVEVNFVATKPHDSGAQWPDMVSVGEVTDLLRVGRPGIVTSRLWGSRPQRTEA